MRQAHPETHQNLIHTDKELIRPFRADHTEADNHRLSLQFTFFSATTHPDWPPQRPVPQHQKSGGDDRDRTDDPLLAKQVLSQLSYAPKPVFGTTQRQ